MKRIIQLFPYRLASLTKDWEAPTKQPYVEQASSITAIAIIFLKCACGLHLKRQKCGAANDEVLLLPVLLLNSFVDNWERTNYSDAFKLPLTIFIASGG